MKKKLKRSQFPDFVGGFGKVTCIMKLTLILILLNVCVAFSSTYSQQTKFTLSGENVSIRDVLSNVESKSEFRFFFNSELINLDLRVNYRIEEGTISQLLDQVLLRNGIQYEVKDRTIILSPKSPNEPPTTAQQQRSVSGKVTDSSGTPLPGVTVAIKGTTQGTITDANGGYSLINVPGNATLVFSFVGMETEEIPVNNKAVINVILNQETIGIEEVVAIGYGTVRKSDLTGAVTKVNMEEVAKLPNISVIQAMQGSVPGLNVGAIDQAGENPTVSIRGQNTLSSSSGDNAPLIVVDGIIYRGSLIDLNTSDIESVDILKDASSAAIYGSQASNGVIIITTKKGETISKPVISYSGSYTLQVPSKTLDPMNGTELAKFFPDIYWDSGSRIAPDYLEPNPEFSPAPFLKTNEISEGYRNGQDTDWWGMLTGDGYINSHDISIRGRNSNLGYFLSGGISDVKGFVKNDTYKKYNYRVNVDAKINDWMNIGLESFVTSSDYSGVSPDLDVTFNLQPWAPIYDSEGGFVLSPNGLSLNPFLTIQQDDADKRLNIFANIHAEVKLPIKGLSYRINFSQNYRTTNQDRFNPWGANYTGSGYKNSYLNYDWTVDNIITYKNTFNEVHNVNATFVYGVEKSIYSYTETGAQNFVNDLLGYDSLEAGDPALRSLNTGKEQEQSLYSMARLLYNYNNKYLITGTVRRDGFSGFGNENKIGIFPSVAIGWVVSQENLIKEHMDWLNYLKLRFSYGSTGRRAGGRYDTKAIVSSRPSIVFGDGGTVTQGQWISSMANNKLGWETTTGLNVGIDFATLKSKLHGNVEYYNNDTRNILYAIQLPEMTGFSGINTNIGKVANHGLEFTVTGQIVNSKNFKWEASVNFSENRNKIISILKADNDGDGKEDNLVANNLFIGKPQQVIYDYEIIGMWQLSDLEAGSIPAGFFPGTYKIADLVDIGQYSASDKKILGYKDPSYRFGITNKIDYRQFRLYVFINSIQGGKDYYYASDDPFVPHKDALSYKNVPRGAWDYWMPENPNAYFRRLDVPGSYPANRYAQRNFIRLQDVSLSYTFRKNMLDKLDIGNLEVFISGKNLLTITNWRGWDPETGVGFTPGRPLMKNYTLGINIEF